MFLVLRTPAPHAPRRRMQLVVIQEEEEHELGGRGARRDRLGCADVDAPRDGCGVAGGPEHPLHRAPGPTPWRRALRAAFPRGNGPPSCAAPSTWTSRAAPGAQDAGRSRGRDGPRVHRSPPRRAARRARSPPRCLTLPPSNARHVAPWPLPVRRSPTARPRPATAKSQPPHAPTADPAPPSSEPSPITLA